MAFGNLFDKLNWGYRSDSAFTVFRGLLRECILETWPIAAGEEVLGEILGARYLHSVVTAARRAGISEALMKRFLIEAGAIRHGDTRPDSRLTFPAAAYSELLSDIPTLAGPAKMRKLLGATAVELKALEEDGVLLPFTRVSTTKARWRLRDGQALLEELTARATPVAGSDARWERLQDAKVRTGVKVGSMIAAIRAGQIQLGQREGVEGYRSLSVLKEHIEAMAGSAAASAPFTISVAAFGRSMAIRDGNRFTALAEAGHLPCSRIINQRTQRAQLVMSEEDIARFHEKYLTLPRILDEFDLHWQTASALLRAKGIRPFSPDGGDYGKIYLRSEAEAVLKRRRG